MEQNDKLLAPLTPQETRWVSELADKLPDHEDLTFQEGKILARIPMDDWPAELLLKVKDLISFEDCMDDSEE